jgi:agmatine deiminase
MTIKKLIEYPINYLHPRMDKKISAHKSTQKSKAANKTVTVGLIQTLVSQDIAANMKHTEEKIVQAAKQGAQIICLQELYRSQYFPQQENLDVSALTESIPGDSTRAFSALAKKLQVVIIAPIFEKNPNGKTYNTAVVIDADGSIAGVYRKAHIPYDPYFYEKDYFAPGEQEYQAYNTKYARIGVLICYDQWFPEPARINALDGAEIIFYPTAIGYIKGHTSADGDWHDAWRTVQRAHAIANGVHVAAVNRVGEEDWLEFWGGSFVCDSFGKVLAEGSTTKEEIIITKLDLSHNQRIKEGWGFLRNRRPDTYNPLTKKVTEEKKQ